MKISKFELLTIIFVVLKLTNTVDWSWWWVFSPTWISFSFGLCVGLLDLLYRKLQTRKN